MRWAPSTSVQVVGAAIGRPRSSVPHVLQREGFHPYYLQKITPLLYTDRPAHQWIGSSGPILSPPRSPDLCSTDFFFLESTGVALCATPVDSKMYMSARN
ncbi:hypothetical protein TNCV_3824501 [Trichonephila clavipes]|nr:hypothetical protein TNCV_3824501 [Trichonephila clavipes]